MSAGMGLPTAAHDSAPDHSAPDHSADDRSVITQHLPAVGESAVTKNCDAPVLELPSSTL
jgi:hypothetical protein